MSRWLGKALARIIALAAERRVLFTLKARRELAGLGFDEQDACEILTGLGIEDSAGRFRSVVTNEWLYVFKPQVIEVTLYLKLILRSDCIVISFHEDEAEDIEANS